MNKKNALDLLRGKLKAGNPSIGSWMQLPSDDIAEIIARSGYDWVAVDMEHGSISVETLPRIFRTLELGETLPFVRLAENSLKACKDSLDAGAAGLIFPMIESSKQLSDAISFSLWPPNGKRGVAFSRANLFGKLFEDYKEENSKTFFVAMIESKKGLDNIEDILSVRGLDAILIGPYDLSASIGITAEFDKKLFTESINIIKEACAKHSIPCGMHVVKPNVKDLEFKIQEGFTFLPYSMDTVFLSESSINPKKL